jgi:zinc/manganese transport system substrate-binding protein
MLPRTIATLMSLIASVALLAPDAQARIRVLTTFLPITAHAMAIAGEDAEVIQLLPNGVGAHDYQLRPTDARKVAQADIIFINGLGLETWVDRLFRTAARPGTPLVDTSAGIETLEGSPLLPWTSNDASPASSHAHGHGHDHDADCEHCHTTAGNPHVWLDPLLALHQARVIAERLALRDPDNAARYQARFEAYAARLTALHEEATVALAPLAGRKLVTFHDSFPYFARRYNLVNGGSIERFPEREPAPRELAQLIATLRANQVEVIFSERGYNPRLLESVARQAGTRIVELDTLEIGTPSPEAYIDGMRSNIRALASAWSEPPSQ